jgi:hypothetical protein
MCQAAPRLNSKDSGRMGGRIRAALLTPEQRTESARKAAQARWARLSSDQRSAIGRSRVMARWQRRNAEVRDQYRSAFRREFEVERAENFSQTESFIRLGAIARHASDLSLDYLDLPAHDRLARTQLLSEFRWAVSQFFKLRASLVERTGPLANVQTNPAIRRG